MAARKRVSISVCRALLLCLAVAMFVAGSVAVVPVSAVAQESNGRWSLRNLLAPFRPTRIEPRPQAPRSKAKARGAVKARSKPAMPAEPEIPVVEKLPDARGVLVVGDFLASGLAEGLATVFAENPRVKILDRSKGSSGFVRDDVFNWPAEIKAMIETEKPAAVIVMLGSNDRQQMLVGGEREPPQSKNWTTEYTARTAALGKAISDSKVPFLWMGMPAFKSTKMSSDMLVFNALYQTATETAGGEFIDVWDGFVDENGAFVTTGPDINGQPVRLRAGDGINMTRAGKRKLAFYAEKPLNKMLGEKTVPADEAVAAGLPSIAPDAGLAAPYVNRTMPIALDDPELDGGSELLGLETLPAKAPGAPGDKSPAEIAPAAAPGRADDFSWPAKAGMPAADSGTTTAINR